MRTPAAVRAPLTSGMRDSACSHRISTITRKRMRPNSEKMGRSAATLLPYRLCHGSVGMSAVHLTRLGASNPNMGHAPRSYSSVPIPPIERTNGRELRQRQWHHLGRCLHLRLRARQEPWLRVFSQLLQVWRCSSRSRWQQPQQRLYTGWKRSSPDYQVAMRPSSATSPVMHVLHKQDHRLVLAVPPSIAPHDHA